MVTLLLFLVLFEFPLAKLDDRIYLPIRSRDRVDLTGIELTSIGKFGEVRRARLKVPTHYHSGIDLKRPSANYIDEPIYPAAKGTVISKRDDGPYAQLIIEHIIDGKRFWTLYEHVAGISVVLGAAVSPEIPMARFMTKDELNRYGWQFDHLHFEVLKVKPQKLRPGPIAPERLYMPYSLTCYSLIDLTKYYYDPVRFLGEHWGKEK